MNTKIKHGSKFKVIAPLSNFVWSGNSFQIDDLCAIEKLDAIPDLSWCKSALSKADTDELGYASHWVSFEQLSKDKLSPNEKINTFLLALWIVCPTRVQVRYRFEFPHKSGTGKISSSVRLLERFEWIKSQARNQIETKHLQKLQGIVDSIKSIYIARKRLWNSLVLTFNGCSTVHWQVAFICFSAAVEGILTYEKGPGITERLAKSFACLKEKTKNQRDSAYRAFKHSYGIRSDIMHGRIAFSTMIGKSKLKELVKFSNLLRNLWKVILSSQSTINELEKNDAGRKTWFAKIEHGYNPPKI
jgi:hypothetical protein